MSYDVSPPLTFLLRFLLLVSSGVMGPSRFVSVAPTPPALPQPWPLACDCLQSASTASSSVTGEDERSPESATSSMSYDVSPPLTFLLRFLLLVSSGVMGPSRFVSVAPTPPAL